MAYLYMLRQLWAYSGRERWKAVAFLLLHALATLGELGRPFAFAMVINTLQQNQPTLVRDVLFWLLVYVACFFVFEVFHISGRYLERYVGFRNRQRFVAAMYDRLQTLPLDWHADHHSGAVIDRINKAGDAIHHYSETQCNYVPVLIKIWGPFIILWQISPAVSMMAVSVGVLTVLITRQLYSFAVPEHRATKRYCQVLWMERERIQRFQAAFFISPSMN